jgi:hypothetical protein
MQAIEQMYDEERGVGELRYSLWTSDLGLAIYLADSTAAEAHLARRVPIAPVGEAGRRTDAYTVFSARPGSQHAESGNSGRVLPARTSPRVAG